MIGDDGRLLSVALASSGTEVLGGRTDNPCTGLGLGIDAILPVRMAEARATAWFVRGDLQALAQALDGPQARPPR